MAKRTSNTKPKSSKGSDLERITQQQAAWLIGKPASWLRDNAHLDGRNTDGSYNARQLVRALNTEYEAAELADGDLEPMVQVVEEAAETLIGTLPAVIQILEKIEKRYGAAGLASVGETLLVECRRVESDEAMDHDLAGFGQPSVEQIQAEADRKIAELATWEARQERRRVICCAYCNRYRWGRQWKKPPLPKDYDSSRVGLCPECEKSGEI